MSEYVIHVEDANTLYENKDFQFPLNAYLREEIVRCRDCKHNHGGDFCGVHCCGIHDDGDGVHYFYPDYFCASGERSDEE